MRGATQQSNIGIGSLGARGTQGLSGGVGVFGGLEGGQQLSEQSQGASMEQAPVGGSERFGALEAGTVGQEALGQAGLGGDAGLSQSAVSRMTEGLGGGAGESLQGIQGMQNIQDIQRMQSMPSALTGGQGQVGMFSDGGGMSALQGQGLMRASLQGGLQSMLGGGGGVTGLQAVGGGGDLGQQQMAFKKVSDFEVSILTLQLTFAAFNFKMFIMKSLFNIATLAKLFIQRVS